MCQRLANRRGVTLVELIVVTAVIAVLAGMLMPVFAQARAKARAVSCQSNERQLACAILMYCSDYDDVLPKAFFTRPPRYPDGHWAASYWWSVIRPYVRNLAVHSCPDAPGRWSGYGYNARLSWHAETDIQKPSQTVLLCDNTLTLIHPHIVAHVSSPAERSTNPGSSFPDPRHLGMCNFAFVDGHVKSLKPESTLSPEDMWDLR
ncbi:MAG: prepilin-type N-terminal cleavage/methylation domain-containing protein, partial [Armatimonadota bacterium]